MRKICLCILILLIFKSIGLAGVEDTWRTDGYLNGHFIVYSLIDKNGGDKGEQIASYYIIGLFDAIQVSSQEFFNNTYHRITIGDFLEAVVQYYRNNPLQRSKAIIEVIMNGCK